MTRWFIAFLMGFYAAGYIEEASFPKRITAFQVVHETKADKAK